MSFFCTILYQTGINSAEIEAAFPGWNIVDESAQQAELSLLLKKLGADPRWYRLRRG